MGTYDCKIINRKISRKRRISRGGGNLNSGYNSVAFSDTTFSIYKLNDNYIAPNRTTSPTYTGTLKQNDIKLSCKVTLSHSTGLWTANSNSKEDFSVHCVSSSTQSPYWSAPTQFNCVVIDYNNSTGELTFNATPTTFGSSIFAIIIRSGSGSGIIKERLPTSTFQVEMPDIFPLWPAGDNGNTLASTSYESPWSNLCWDVTKSPLNFTEGQLAPYAASTDSTRACYYDMYMDLTMHQWSDGSQVTSANIKNANKFQTIGPFFKQEYYSGAGSGTFFSQETLLLLPTRRRYYFDLSADFKWGYSVRVSATRIGLCFDLRGSDDVYYNAYVTAAVTWKLYAYPNVSYNAGERVTLGTFSLSQFGRKSTYVWVNLSAWPSGQKYTHFQFTPSTLGIRSDWVYCPPILGH